MPPDRRQKDQLEAIRGLGIEEKGIKLSGKKVARPIYGIKLHEWEKLPCSKIRINLNLTSAFQNEGLAKLQEITFHVEASNFHS